MKRNYDMKQGIFVFLMAMGALLLASCEADPVDTTRRFAASIHPSNAPSST